MQIKPQQVIHFFFLFVVSVVLMIAYIYLFLYEFKPASGVKPIKTAIFYTLSEPCKKINYSPLNADDEDGSKLEEYLRTCRNSILANEPKPIPLPHYWKDNENESFQYGWYSIKTPSKENLVQTLYSLVIPKSNMNIAVLVNDTLIGWRGTFDQRTRSTAHPIQFSIPHTVLESSDDGVSRIYIYLESTPQHMGFLGKIYLLPQAMTEDAFNLTRFIKVTLLQMVIAIQIMFGIHMFILWLQRFGETEYVFFSTGTLLWAFSTYLYITPYLPLSSNMWDWLFYSSTGLFAVNSMYFIHRLLGEKYTVVETCILFVAIVLILIMALNQDFLHLGGKILLSLCYILGSYVLFYSIYKIRRIRDIELTSHIVYIGAILLSMAFSTHDMGVILGLLPWGNGLYLGYASIAILFAFAWLLVRRFVLTLESVALSNQTLKSLNLELHAFNKNLESRVKEQCKIINKQYVEKTDIERQRLLKDIHDGIGLHLATILNQLDRRNPDLNSIKSLSQDALIDLRLLVDSMGTANKDIGRILGMFRQRIASNLKNLGIELQWDVDVLPEIDRFGAEEALHLLRICQEIVANSIKYSEASCIKIQAREDSVDNQIIVMIEDNGKGFDASTITLGTGLNNLHQRAEAIGATIDIRERSENSGTCIVLKIPINPTNLTNPINEMPLHPNPILSLSK